MDIKNEIIKLIVRAKRYNFQCNTILLGHKEFDAFEQWEESVETQHYLEEEDTEIVKNAIFDRIEIIKIDTNSYLGIANVLKDTQQLDTERLKALTC